LALMGADAVVDMDCGEPESHRSGQRNQQMQQHDRIDPATQRHHQAVSPANPLVQYLFGPAFYAI